MEDGHIPKDLLYGELSGGSRSRGRPRLRFKDTFKGDLKSASIGIQSWKSLVESRDSWRAAVHCGTKEAKQDRTDHLMEIRATRKSSSTNQAATAHDCRLCGKDCHSRIGLHRPDLTWCSHRLPRRKEADNDFTNNQLNRNL